MKPAIFKIFEVVLLITVMFSCNDKNDNQNITPVVQDLSGTWEFIISPDQVFQDTALIKDHRSSDFEIYSAIVEDVYLYQSGDQIAGYSGPYKFTGSVIGDNVVLNIFDHPDGDYEPGRPVEEMFLVTNIALQVDNFQMMKGTCKYSTYQEYPDMVKNIYKIEAHRTGKFNNGSYNSRTVKDFTAVSNWTDDICALLYTIPSWIISYLSDGIVRPMSSDCWLHKDGGGYYAFGHQGPGNVFPIFTQSAYYPLEWSACHVREYTFNISLGSESLSYTLLKNLIENNPPSKDFIQKLGFTGIPLIMQALDDFHAQFGGFAITLFYNDCTHNTTIYVNHSQGDHNAAINSVLVQSIKDASHPHSSNVFVYAGKNISDTQHLRRSPIPFVCSSPILICYLLGTNTVSYN